MANEWSPDDEQPPPSVHSAFVVHLMATGADAPEVVRGRIEHVSSGQWTRFASVAELIGFMRHTLAAVGVFAVLVPVPELLRPPELPRPSAALRPTTTAATLAPPGDREARSPR